MNSIFLDICQEIDIFNHDYQDKEKLTLKDKYQRYVRRKKLLKLIDKILNVPIYNISTLYFFFVTYNSTVNIISLDKAKIIYSDINHRFSMEYNKNDLVIKLFISDANNNTLNVISYNKQVDEYSYSLDFMVYNKLQYKGTDDRREKMVNFIDAIFRETIAEYLYKRLGGIHK